MTVNQSRSGGPYGGYSAAGRERGTQAKMRREFREGLRTRSRAAEELPGEEPILYVYGDRICRRDIKRRQMFRAYGVLPKEIERGTPRKVVRVKPWYTRLADRVFENKAVVKLLNSQLASEIIRLFDSMEAKKKEDVAAAKRNAIMRKKLIEHRRGLSLALFMIVFLTAITLLIYNLFFGIDRIYAGNTLNYSGDAIVTASGLTLGDKLYSFRAGDVEDRITFVCPYIRNVEVTRTVPNKVDLKLESDTAVYYCNVYGEQLLLSAGLRVLGPYTGETGLTELYLPEIRYSVAGRVITFAEEKNDRAVRDLLSVIAGSGLAGRIGLADLRNPYDIVMHCDGKYILSFGGEKELSHKLKMVEKTIADPDFRTDTPAEIDLSIVGEASVRYDHNLKLSEEGTAGETE